MGGRSHNGGENLNLGVMLNRRVVENWGEPERELDRKRKKKGGVGKKGQGCKGDKKVVARGLGGTVQGCEKPKVRMAGGRARKKDRGQPQAARASRRMPSWARSEHPGSGTGPAEKSGGPPQSSENGEPKAKRKLRGKGMRREKLGGTETSLPAIRWWHRRTRGGGEEVKTKEGGKEKRCSRLPELEHRRRYGRNKGGS